METTSGTFTVTYDCPFRNNCVDNGKKCDSCLHSPNRSYYEPIPIPYYPFYYPYYPWTITYCDTTSQSHYQAK